MIELKNVTIQQGDFELTDISFVVEKGNYAVLMGPSGCGKTTILEAICGLKRINSGSIFIDNVDVTHLPPAQRGIGYVPQDRSLFPAMRLDKQIGYGLAVRGLSSAKRQTRTSELAELTGITHLLKRLPLGLSGGEIQRVALARALAFYPKVLCLDEPLSALDQEVKSKTISLLRLIQQQERVTLIHVTHHDVDARQLGSVKFRLANSKINRIDSLAAT